MAYNNLCSTNFSLHCSVPCCFVQGSSPGYGAACNSPSRGAASDSPVCLRIFCSCYCPAERYEDVFRCTQGQLLRQPSLAKSHQVRRPMTSMALAWEDRSVTLPSGFVMAALSWVQAALQMSPCCLEQVLVHARYSCCCQLCWACDQNGKTG